MSVKTIRLSGVVYIYLKESMLKDEKKTGLNQSMSDYLKGLLDEHNRI